MRVLVEVLIVAFAATLIIYVGMLLLRRSPADRRWEPVERVDAEGTLHIGVARGTEFRTVKTIPSSADEIDVLSDVRIAKRDAADLAAELNRKGLPYSE